MITLKEIKAQEGKDKREFKKMIEKQLHPTLKIGDIDILHEHRGQKIEFSAWVGGNLLQPLTERKYLSYDRVTVGCYEGNFYADKMEDFQWLIAKK